MNFLQIEEVTAGPWYHFICQRQSDTSSIIVLWTPRSEIR